VTAVLDASLAVDLALGLARLPDLDEDLVVPTYFILEVTAVMSRLVRTRKMTVDDAVASIADIEALGWSVLEPDTERAWILACGSLGYYDARNAAVAEQLSCPVWSTDQRFEHPSVIHVPASEVPTWGVTADRGAVTATPTVGGRPTTSRPRRQNAPRYEGGACLAGGATPCSASTSPRRSPWSATRRRSCDLAAPDRPTCRCQTALTEPRRISRSSLSRM